MLIITVVLLLTARMMPDVTHLRKYSGDADDIFNCIKGLLDALDQEISLPSDVVQCIENAFDAETYSQIKQQIA